MPQPMLKASQVAKLLGIHLNTVKRIPANVLPYVVVSTRGDRRYTEDDIFAYLERNKVDA